MNELIKIRNDGGKQTVNARELHAFLEVKQDFSGWIKNQIERARLVENRDYVTLTEKRDRQILVEYHMTLEAGKHVSMMSGTDKGFDVRDYFIECERVAHQPALDPTNLSRMQLIQIAMDAEGERLLLAEKIEVLAPKAEIADRLILSEDGVNLTTAAKIIGMPPHKFIRELNRAEWIYKRIGSRHWAAHQAKINSGYLDQKIHQFVKGDGMEGSSPQVFILPKGMARLTTMFGVTTH